MLCHQSWTICHCVVWGINPQTSGPQAHVINMATLMSGWVKHSVCILMVIQSIYYSNMCFRLRWACDINCIFWKWPNISTASMNKYTSTKSANRPLYFKLLHENTSNYFLWTIHCHFILTYWQTPHPQASLHHLCWYVAALPAHPESWSLLRGQLKLLTYSHFQCFSP